MASGNGTLNKTAGIDYKQLSMLAKINENHSGEVSSFTKPNHTTVATQTMSLYGNTDVSTLSLSLAAVAGPLAGHRDCGQDASCAGLDY